jgi:hypothetical protein
MPAVQIMGTTSLSPLLINYISQGVVFMYTMNKKVIEIIAKQAKESFEECLANMIL